MTRQRRTLIEPADIVGLEYECAHCGSRYLVPLKRFDRRVAHCPNCQKKWVTGGPGDGAQSDEQTISLFESVGQSVVVVTDNLICGPAVQ